ncbi:TPA: MFS transporter [Streptococcus suis]|nr:MFS transporter [Streptococcus suis]
MNKEIPLKRLVPGLIIGPASWLGPYIVASSLFLPSLLQEIDGQNKIQLLALFSTCGMIVAAISNMVAGNLSDRTYSKFGKRTPWLIGGSLVFMLTMILSSIAHSVPYLLIVWMISQVALNFIVAPMVAWLDMAPEEGKGTASGAYGGLGMALGNNGFTIFGAMLLGQFRLGFVIFGIITFIGTLIAALIVREPSNLEEKNNNGKKVKSSQKSNQSLGELLKIFPSWSIGRDYYLALFGKLAQGVGNFAITGYLLFIMTDFLGKSTNGAQSSIQIVNTIMLIFGIAMGFLAGPISDKLKILKMPLVFSTLSLAVGALGIFLLKNDTSIWLYGLFAGLGMGIWNSLDNLLNLKVIPDPERVAFYLGVYNLGNTITQALAPIIAAAVIEIYGFSAIFIVSFVFALLGGACILMIKSVK